MHVVRPLHNLTRKNAPFNWDDDCEAAFLELKEWLTSMPILVAPRKTGTYVLDTDASDTVLGAVTQQEQDGELRVIAYANQVLSHAERRYCITHRQLLGVVYGLKGYASVWTVHLRLHGPCCVDLSYEDAGTHWPAGAMAGPLVGVRPGTVHGNSNVLSR